MTETVQFRLFHGLDRFCSKTTKSIAWLNIPRDTEICSLYVMQRRTILIFFILIITAQTLINRHHLNKETLHTD